MDERELRTIIEKINETDPKTEEQIKKIEYMMDFGSVAVLVNMSLN
jgi:hypothetical protein